ncbi:MAG TPA: hypothetical protein GX702_05430 [Chloroflexi bacterium]|nr:hypothetical protein [Chloroflexota bacterium]
MRASVIELNEGTAEMVGVSVAPVHGLRGGKHPDVDRWFAGCDQALTEAEDMTALSGGHKIVPDYAAMALPTEITRDLPVVIEQERRHPRQGITMDEITHLLRKGYRTAQDIVGTRQRHTTEDIICGNTATFVVDGQAIADPLAVEGERIELRMRFSLAPLEWIRAMEIVAERLQLGLTCLVPHHVLYAAPLIDPAALLILLDEQNSTVGLARRGRLEWTGTVPIGERDILRATTETLVSREQQGETLMRAYRAGQLREEIETQVARCFWGELRHWMTTLARQIRSLHRGGPLPQRIYFLDLTRRIPEAYPSLETPFWEESLPFDGCPEVVELGVGTIRNVLDCTSQAGGPPYLLLRALAHHVASMFAPGDNLDRALAEMIRWRRSSSATRSR